MGDEIIGLLFCCCNPDCWGACISCIGNCISGISSNGCDCKCDSCSCGNCTDICTQCSCISCSCDNCCDCCKCSCDNLCISCNGNCCSCNNCFDCSKCSLHNLFNSCNINCCSCNNYDCFGLLNNQFCIQCDEKCLTTCAFSNNIENCSLFCQESCSSFLSYIGNCLKTCFSVLPSNCLLTIGYNDACFNGNNLIILNTNMNSNTHYSSKSKHKKVHNNFPSTVVMIKEGETRNGNVHSHNTDQQVYPEENIPQERISSSDSESGNVSSRNDELANIQCKNFEIQHRNINNNTEGQNNSTNRRSEGESNSINDRKNHGKEDDKSDS